MLGKFSVAIRRYFDVIAVHVRTLYNLFWHTFCYVRPRSLANPAAHPGVFRFRRRRFANSAFTRRTRAPAPLKSAIRHFVLTRGRQPDRRKTRRRCILIFDVRNALRRCRDDKHSKTENSVYRAIAYLPENRRRVVCFRRNKREIGP